MLATPVPASSPSEEVQRSPLHRVLEEYQSIDIPPSPSPFPSSNENSSPPTTPGATPLVCAGCCECWVVSCSWVTPSVLRKLGLYIALLIACAVVMIYLSSAGYVGHLLAWIERNSRAGMFIMASITLFISLPVPVTGIYTLLMVGSGFIWGVGRGYLLIAISSLIGYTLVIVIGRRFSHQWLDRRVEAQPNLQLVLDAVNEQGLKLVICMRTTFIPYSLQNGLLILCHIPSYKLIITSYVALSVPQLLYAYIGSTLRDLSSVAKEGGKNGGKIAAMVVQLVAIIFMICVIIVIARRILLRLLKRTREHQQATHAHTTTHTGATPTGDIELGSAASGASSSVSVVMAVTVCPSVRDLPDKDGGGGGSVTQRDAAVGVDSLDNAAAAPVLYSGTPRRLAGDDAGDMGGGGQAEATTPSQSPLPTSQPYIPIFASAYHPPSRAQHIPGQVMDAEAEEVEGL